MPAGDEIIHRCQCDLSAVAQHLVHLIGGGVAVDGDEILFVAFQRFQSLLRALSNEDQSVMLLSGIVKHLRRRLFDFRKVGLFFAGKNRMPPDVFDQSAALAHFNFHQPQHLTVKRVGFVRVDTG